MPIPKAPKIPGLDFISKADDALKTPKEVLGKGVEKSIDGMKSAWNWMKELVDGLDAKEHLAGMMSGLVGILDWLGIVKKKKEEPAQADNSESSRADSGTIPNQSPTQSSEAERKEKGKRKPTKSKKELRAQIEAERKAREKAPKLYDLDRLQHWDLSKDMSAQERMKLYPDQLVGFYKSESGWTQCSGSGLSNEILLNRLGGGKKKLILPVQNSDHAEMIKEALEATDKEKKIVRLKLRNRKEPFVADLSGLTKADLLPRGDADMIEIFYTRLQVDRISGSPEDIVRKLDLSGKTLCDLITHGSSKYGHRSVAIKTEAGWFVIDPYRSYKGQRSTKPIPIMDYMEGTEDGVKKRKGTEVRFAVPIDTSSA